MKYRWVRPILILFMLVLWVCFSLINPVEAGTLAQQPTVDFPTVTGTPRGPYVVVNAGTANDSQINVRAGPNQLTEKVGVLLVGQEVPAIGRYGDWVQIEYPGVTGGKAWVFGNLVTVFGGDLPLIVPPPTSTPNTTRTVDPTLAAQFLTTPQATRLPTFTQPAPLEIPTFTVDVGNTASSGIPIGLIIVGLGALGIFLGVIALISGR